MSKEANRTNVMKPPAPPVLSTPPPSPNLEAERLRRLELEALNGLLARKRCRHCGTLGAWDVKNTEPTGGRIRYIRCKGCRRFDQVCVVIRDGVAVETQEPAEEKETSCP
jgi:hypothetical protein